MKRVLILALLAALLVNACGAAAPERQPFRLIVANDLHYIAPALTDHGAYFTRLTEGGDGKLMRYTEELTDAFLAEVCAAKPDALLLTGDLSFNGALLSHAALAAKLGAVEDAGIPVLVLPGNHDLENPSAAAFSGDGYRRVPSATAEDFRRIYARFGYDEALSRDADSLSYMAALGDGKRVLILDFNTPHDPCGISEQSLRWVGEQLREARQVGDAVLAAGHQNLFQHSMFTGGYVIGNAARLAELLREYGVRLFLSGHLHIQHHRTEQGLTEITTGALSVFPCHYGVLSEEGGRLRYEARETDVSAWAAAQGRSEPALLDFRSYAAAYFDRRSAREIPEELALYAYTPEEIERMTAYLLPLNRAYFSGDLREAGALDPTGELFDLWQRCPSLYSLYLLSIQPDMGRDYRVWESE